MTVSSSTDVKVKTLVVLSIRFIAVIFNVFCEVRIYIRKKVLNLAAIYFVPVRVYPAYVKRMGTNYLLYYL